MEHPDYYKAGKILRTHGVKGDMVIYLDADDLARYKKLKVIYVDTQEQLKEFDITKIISIKEKEKTAVVHLSGIDDMDTAEKYLKYELYLPLVTLPKLKGKKFYFHEIIGYMVIDENNEEQGKLTNVYDLPQHPIGEFFKNEKPVLFPLMEEFIIKIDRKENKLHMKFPDGLLDVYLK